MGQFSFTVTGRVIDATVNDPELRGLSIDVDAGDDADPFDNGVSIAAVLATHKFDGKRIVLVSHRVIKEQVAIWRSDY